MAAPVINRTKMQLWNVKFHKTITWNGGESESVDVTDRERARSYSASNHNHCQWNRQTNNTVFILKDDKDHHKYNRWIERNQSHGNNLPFSVCPIPRQGYKWSLNRFTQIKSNRDTMDTWWRHCIPVHSSRIPCAFWLNKRNQSGRSSYLWWRKHTYCWNKRIIIGSVWFSSTSIIVITIYICIYMYILYHLASSARFDSIQNNLTKPNTTSFSCVPIAHTHTRFIKLSSQLNLKLETETNRQYLLNVFTCNAITVTRIYMSSTKTFKFH